MFYNGWVHSCVHQLFVEHEDLKYYMKWGRENKLEFVFEWFFQVTTTTFENVHFFFQFDFSTFCMPKTLYTRKRGRPRITRRRSIPPPPPMGQRGLVEPINAGGVTLEILLMIVGLKSREPTFGHGPSPTQVDITTHLFAYVYTASHDSFDSQLVNPRIILAPYWRFKQSFGTAVSGCIHSNASRERNTTI